MMVRQLTITALLLACGTALAADDPVQRAQRCAGIADSLERLVCYDGLFRADAPPAGDAAADFGAEQLRGAAGREESQEARTLTATVTELRETRRNVFRVTLDNGQIWQQMDMDSLFHLQAGDTVEINRGRLGGYRMGRTSRGGSAWVRVNRLK